MYLEEKAKAEEREKQATLKYKMGKVKLSTIISSLETAEQKQENNDLNKQYDEVVGGLSIFR